MNKKVMSAREKSIRAMYDAIAAGDTVRAKFGAHTVTFHLFEGSRGRDLIGVESWGRSAITANFKDFRHVIASTAAIAQAARTGAVEYTVNTPEPNRVPFSYGDHVREKGTGRTGWVVSGGSTAAEVMWDGVNGAAQRLEAGVSVDSLIMVKAWAA